MKSILGIILKFMLQIGFLNHEFSLNMYFFYNINEIQIFINGFFFFNVGLFMAIIGTIYYIIIDTFIYLLLY